MDTEQKGTKLKILCGFLIFFSLLIEKLGTPWGYYNIWDFAFKIGDGSLMVEDLRVLLTLSSVILALLTNILYFVRSIWLIKKKNPKYFIFLPGVGMVVYAICFQPYFLINIVLVVVDYMGVRWLQERDEINEAYKRQKANEKLEQAEKKRIKYFPGRYPEEFFQMVRKNYIYTKKGQILLLAACFFTAMCIYVMLTMYGLIAQVHGKEDFMSSNGLIEIFRNTGLLVAVLCIIMLILVISYYIGYQKKANNLLLVLGMRSRTVYLIFVIVFSVNALSAGICGIVSGSIAAYIIKNAWQSVLSHSGVEITLASIVNGKSIVFCILGYLLAVLLALGLNQENILSLARSMNMNIEVQKENRNHKHAFLLMGIGIMLCIQAIRWCFIRGWAESIYIHIVSVLGILLLLSGGTVFYLNRLKSDKDKYYRKIIVNRPLYYRYKKSFWNLFYLSVIHFFILSVFSVQFAGSMMEQNIADLYPYDIVGTVYHADIENLIDVAEEHNAEGSLYPMFRMTSLYGSDKLVPWFGPRPIQYPQGQHIAISESTYRTLKEKAGKIPKQLNLSGEEMHVVYQQDLSVKAHTIDWDTNRVNKHLRIGQPLMYYNPADVDTVFPVREIKSEERDILTGAFHQGMGENLIVLSDKYFESEYEKITEYNKQQWSFRESASYEEWTYYTGNHTSNLTEGPTSLFCFHVSQDEYDALVTDIRYLEDKYRYDKVWDESIRPFYEKQQMIIDTGAEIFFRRLVYFFIVLLLTIMGLFQYYVKLEAEVKEMNWQNVFLKKLGTREKDRKKAMIGQMRLFVTLPLAIGVCGGLIFTSLAVRARLYEFKEILNYVCLDGCVYLIYIAIWAAWYVWMKKLIWRQAEWGNN